MQKREYKLNSSHTFRVLLSLLLIASLFICLTLGLPVWIRLAIMGLVLIEGVWLMWSQRLIGTHQTVALREVGDHRWLITLPAGEMMGTLRGDSTLTAKVSILRFNIATRRLPLSLIIFSDAMCAGDYQQLVATVRSGC